MNLILKLTLIVMITISMVNASSNDLENTSNNLLSKEEVSWLKQNRNITIATFRTWIPFDITNEKQEHIGFHADMINLINKKFSTNMVLTTFDSWKDSYNAVTSGEVNAITNLSWSQEREDTTFIYSPAYHFSPYQVIVRKNSGLSLLSQLSDKTVAIREKSISLKIAQDKVPDAKIRTLSSADDVFKSIQEGSSYATFMASIDQNDLDKYNLKVAIEIFHKAGEIHIGTNKKYPIVASIINKGINSITLKEMADLREKWLVNYMEKINKKEIKKSIPLTNKEIQWLRKKVPVKYVYDSDWAPFEWTSEIGEHTGIINDLLNLVRQRSGLILEEINVDKWSDAVKLAQNNKVDMYSAVGENINRKEYMNFTTNSLYKSPYVFLVHEDNTKDYFETFKALNESEKVAIVDGYAIQGILKEKEPKFKPKTVDSILEGFNKLKNKELDIFIINSATAKYYINHNGFNALKIATKTQYSMELKVAIQKTFAPEALSIIDKVIASISEKELADIYYKWTAVKIQKKTDWSLLLKIIGASSLLIGFILYNNRRLKLTVNEKTSELTLLLSSFNKNVIASNTDTKGIITYVSDAFCKISGYERSELIGQNQNIVRHPDTPKEVFKDLWETIKTGNTWEGEIKNKIKTGGFYWVSAIILPEYDSKGALIGYSAIRHDITSQKEVEALSSSLESKVEERTKELKDSQKDIEDQKKYIDSIMNSQNNIVISTDGLVLRSANKAFLEFYDVLDCKSFMKNYGDCICDTFDIDDTGKNVQKMMGEEKWVEYVYARPDTLHKTSITRNGTLYIFGITADKFSFKGEELLVAVFTDITERENLVIDMITTNLKLKNISDTLTDLIFYKDLDLKYTGGNKAFYEFMGKSEDEIIGKTDFELFPKEIANAIDARERNLFDTARSIIIDENIPNGDGKIRNLAVQKHLLYDGNDEIYGMVGSVQDITQRKELELKLIQGKNEIESIHKHTRDSIEYAALIQGALLPDEKLLDNYFQDSFVHWIPKDTVGGDIWLFSELRNPDECLLFFIDCTGHGVPGAFVTMIVKSIEREIIANILDDKDMDVSPAWVMSYFNKTMKVLLKQENENTKSNAGWDGGIIYYNKKKKVLKFAGAETTLFYMDNDNTLNTIKGNHSSVGYQKCKMNYEYKETVLEVSEGMKFYCTTDGYLDQCGGQNNFPFYKRRFGNIIKMNNEKPMQAQKEIFINEMHNYEAMVEDNERNDDITLIAFEI